MVVVDSTVLLLLLQPSAGVPSTAGGQAISLPAERVAHLVAALEKSGDHLMIPTPVLAEVLVRAPAGKTHEIVEELNKSSVFKIVSFDALAAIEVALMSRAALDGGRKARSSDADTFAKVKYDRQIIAMAKVARATAIYSDDKGLRTMAEQAGIPVIGLADLSLPPSSTQFPLPLE